MVKPSQKLKKSVNAFEVRQQLIKLPSDPVGPRSNISIIVFVRGITYYLTHICIDYLSDKGEITHHEQGRYYTKFTSE